MNTPTTISFAVDERTPEQREIIAQINAHHQLHKEGAVASKLIASNSEIAVDQAL